MLGSVYESERANATFFYEGSNSGVKVKLRPEVIFRTNKVSLKQSCLALQTAAKFHDERVMEYQKLVLICFRLLFSSRTIPFFCIGAMYRIIFLFFYIKHCAIFLGTSSCTSNSLILFVL